MIFYEKDFTLQPGKTLYVVPFGDIQTGKEYDRLEGLVNWLLARKHEGHLVAMFGMGDYFESPSPSDRAALRAAKRGFGMYEELAKDIENVYETRCNSIASYFAPLQGDIMGLLKGHHYLEFISSGKPADTNRLLSKLVGADYWGTDVVIGMNINGLRFEILATHGYGSARTPGARVIKRHRMREVYLTANWYAMGHDNEKSVYVTEALVGRRYLKQYYSGTGSFQRSYNFDETAGTYAEELMLPPSALGVVMMEIRLQEHNGKLKLDYHIST